MSDFTELTISGRIATPADSDWDQARAAWNLAADQNPSAVAFVESAEDVAKTLRFAAAHGLRVSGQGTGHGAVALGSLEDTILIKTERMRGIEIDPEAQRARVEAGVLVLELGEATQAHGLSSMPGSAPDVGVTGYTLGGGLSWLGRRYGFACNRVSAIELVTAAGEALTVDAENDADLFWALRGGGGDYAIVTALHLDLVPVAETYAGALLYPAALGAEGVRAYRDWAASLGDDATTVVRFLRPPDMPDVPEPLRNTPLLTIDGACIGDQAAGEATLAPLRAALGEPIMDTFGQIPSAGLCRIHMDPEQPVPGLGNHTVIRELPDAAVDAFAALADPESSPLLLTELRQLGGALGRADENGGALTHLDAAFVMLGVGLPMTPELGQAIEGHLDRFGEAMGPWAADGGYFNFAERPCDTDAIHSAETCTRLAEVKRVWDPDGTIVANHPVALDAAA
ncbi:MAG TPA: FAD-binding oxidoreductase [Solirubrobacterales bacterium]|nr:FAD-binding oxidoreductase [Solirubrobacterales bacterium]